MASSTIDALFQIAAPRAAEPRGAEAAPFDPALRQALAPGRPAERTAPRAADAPRDEPEPPADGEEAVSGAMKDDRADDWPNEAVGENAEPAVIAEEADAGEEEVSPEDEVAISAAAAAALAAAEAKSGDREKGSATKSEVKTDAVDAAVGEAADAGSEGASAAGASAGAATADLDGTTEGSEPGATIAGGKNEQAAKPEQNAESGRQRTARDEQAVEENAEVRVREGDRSELADAANAEASVDARDGAADQEDSPAPAVSSSGEPRERRTQRDDRIEMKPTAAEQPPPAAGEAAAAEAPIEAKPQVEATPARTEPAVAAAASNSASRSSAGLEKLVGTRGVMPTVADGTAADGGAPVDRARFVQRVEGALRRAQDRDGRLHVRLSPPELGSLRVEITLQNGVLTAKLEAETTAARNLIMENLPALRERLAQQDVRIEKFDVDVRRDGAEAGSEGGGHSGGAQDRRSELPAGRREERRQSPTAVRSTRVDSPTGAKPQASAAGLDVRV